MRIRKWDVACRLNFNFLHSPLDFFPENLGEASDEQGESFNQDIKSTEYRSSFWNDFMMQYYCWMLYCDDPDTSHHTKRKSAQF
jgi:hypothetical protein